MASEKSRAREVYSYYQTWLETFAALPSIGHEIDNDRFHLDGSILKASRDDALTAFAQLGCLRLGAKRVLVTLIGSLRQYILAEATKSLSIRSGQTDDTEEDEIWFGNASIPRSQGVSEHALYPPDYTAVGTNGHNYTTPALVINDLTEDERFHTRDFAGNGVTFYCGTPIVSKSGNSIGVYTVIDDKPRDGISPNDLQFLRDMSGTVMRHLETVRNNAARFRGERMVQGLGNFMKGKMSILNESTNKRAHRSDQFLGPPEVVAEQFKGMDITNADPDILRAIQTLRKAPDGGASTLLSKDSSNRKSGSSDQASEDVDTSVHNLKIENLDEQNVQQSMLVRKGPLSKSQKVEMVFTRAANMLLECADADGVVFFDAAPVNLTKRSVTLKSVLSPVDEKKSSGDGGLSESTDGYSSGPSTDSDTSVESQPGVLELKGQRCPMLGYALNMSSQSTANATTVNKLGLTERSLKYFIRRYPRGKSFFFSAEGDLSASEEDASDDFQANRSKIHTLESAINTKSGKISTKSIGRELSSVVPGARNIIWLPLWDYSKQRWCAGLFLWSRRPHQLLTVQDDMAYLRTFGHSIMNEMSRIDAESANEAKSTFIANVSHELRSPLHGILGSIEFLQDTSLDAFQSSMTLAVETCAKSLLDTVEHVLDYSKINEVSAKPDRPRKNRRTSETQFSGSSIAEVAVELDVLLEEAIEAIFAGQTFRTSQQDPTDENQFSETVHLSKNMNRSTKRRVQRASNKFSGSVRLIVDVEKRSSWWFQTQPGAIRRIVMNILGNSLKYTDQGTIHISLKVVDSLSQDPRVEKVCLTVKDTGRGMSAEFLENHAFVPFSQESQFSVGTGLGLSIVQQILDSINGKIELQSKKGVGTEVNIYLTLPTMLSPTPPAHRSNILSIVTPRTRNLTLCLLKKPKSTQILDDGADDLVEKSLKKLAKTWFGMKAISVSSMDAVVADFFMYAEPPPIEYLLHHHGQHVEGKEIPLIILATNAYESAALTANGIHKLTELGRVLEVISQPCGPQKLARALQSCFNKLDELSNKSKTLNTTRPDSTVIMPHSQTHSNSGVPKKNELRKQDDGQVERPQYAQQHPSSIAINNSVPKSPEPQIDSGQPGPQIRDLSAQVVPIRVVRCTSSLSGLQGQRVLAQSNSDKPSPPVLLVDDNDINLNLLVAFVKKAGHPYVKAKNGLEAVRAFETANTTPDTAFKYVLMDISMPVMDGLNATREIRQLEKKYGLKTKATIIVLTGLVVQGIRDEILQAGADYYLSKPIKFKELTNYLRS